jgi:adenine/guanine phosphoribosyltransferase-like PRPP-binding protein
LAVLASSNDRVQEALAPSAFPGFTVSSSRRGDRVEAAPASPSQALVQQLDDLAQDIVNTPGAGGALLAAYAAQARALSMVVEAARRAGSSPLPAVVLAAAQEALSVPSPLPGFAIG